MPASSTRRTASAIESAANAIAEKDPDELIEDTREFVTTPVYRRERLRAGHRLPGPAIVEQMDSTTVILGGQEAEVDAGASLVIHVGTA